MRQRYGVQAVGELAPGVDAASALMQEPPEGTSFSTFLGCEPKAGPQNALAFRSEDMDVPFVSHNDAMWGYFEPELGRRLAKHYLKTTAMGTDQIAYLLGYLELNSFLRAFSSWCDMSPSEWRRRNA
jgi:hypothetical protein